MIQDPLAWLFALEQLGIKFGLENIRAIVEALGHPERAFRSVHIAGTNGKGSVTAIVDTALRAAGHRSARYTSPHLVSLNERFAIDGRPVGDDELMAAAGHVRGAVEALVASHAVEVYPTFFEVTTAIAFELFRRARVDVAVLEVGLGGRLDATNVVSPFATAITSIAFDHEQFLGRTLAAIAREKAGIIKPGVPVVVGRVASEADAAIAAVARDRGADLIRAWDGVRVTPRGDEAGRFALRTPLRDYGIVAPALRGDHQIDNAVVAVRLLETIATRELPERALAVGADAIVRGVEEVSWPGRAERRRLPDGREALLDAAHNPAGASALASYLQSSGGRRPLVFAAMRDKDAAGILGALLPVVSALVVTRASTPRSADPAQLAEVARSIAPGIPIAIAPSAAEALAEAWRLSTRIVVAGSIFLLGDVLREIT